MIADKFLDFLNRKILFHLRFDYLTNILIPYLTGCKTVLDLGASSGELAKKIQDKIGVEFTGVDTHIQPKSFIPVIKYDGKKLPFRNNSFECVMIIDVLHHDTNPEEVITEAKRVAKKYILIKDHYWISRFDFWLLKISDYIGNHPYKIKLPYNFLKYGGWKDVFNQKNLRIVTEKKFRYNAFDPCKHIIFFLEK
ncbi:MAG: methyltransferase domain-containing protein [Candidatus Nanoarchaeia archaeon]|nr:methyltransferase domain-containing protein [Candidatus Nanoarchaeia archaeon]